MVLFLKNLAFTILFPGILGVLVPTLVLAKERFSLEGFRAFAIIVLVVGASIYFWCLWEFGRRGRGTPAPIDPPKVLVVRGLYRYMRNPMYVGVLLLVIGQAIAFASWPILVYGLCSALLFHVFIVYYEEPTLRRQFGQAYDEYVDRVPRWVPRVGRL